MPKLVEMIKEMKSLINLLHGQVKGSVSFLHSQLSWRFNTELLQVSFSSKGFVMFLQQLAITFQSAHSKLIIHCLPIHRWWEWKHQGWPQRPLLSPLTSPISLMSCSPVMSFFNTSSSFVIGHTEHSSASNQKSLQYNDDPQTIWLQSNEDTLNPASAMSVCTSVNSIP